jgi:dihydrodipicolinate synthase/N-acetylneuraminate lyase
LSNADHPEQAPDFQVLSGDDLLTLPMLSIGGTGVISLIANACPKQFSDMVNLGLSGNFDKASVLHYKLLPLMNALFEEGSPAGVKATLEILRITQGKLGFTGPETMPSQETGRVLRRLGNKTVFSIQYSVISNTGY